MPNDRHYVSFGDVFPARINQPIVQPRADWRRIAPSLEKSLIFFAYRGGMKRTNIARLARASFVALSISIIVVSCSRSTDDHAALARAAIESSDYTFARIHLENALRESPNNPDLIFQTGQVALELGDPVRAEAAFRRLTAHPKYAKAASDYLAKAFVMEGNAKRALDVLGSVPPSTGIGHGAKVAALFAQGDFEEGFVALDTGLRLFPKSIDLALLDGTRANALGDTDRMANISQRLTKEAPKNVDVLLFAGRVALIQRRLDIAEGHFEQVLTLRRGNPTALIALGGIASDRGEKKEAETFFKQARASAPGDPLTAYLLAQLAYDAGQIEQARDILLSSKAESSSLPAAAMLRGIIASRRGFHEEAISVLQRYLADGGDDPRARVGLATSLAAVGENSKALEALRPVANAANASPATLQLAATLAETTGNGEAARYRERLTASAAPDPIAKWMKQADAAIRRGDWKSADRIYTDLLTKGHGKNLILLNNASAVRLELGDERAAVSLAQRAYRLAPDDPYVLDTLGWALFNANGSSPEAIGYLRQAAQRASSNAEILRHLAAASTKQP